MFSLQRPTDEFIRAYLIGQAGRPWSYDQVAATRSPALSARPGWKLDRQRVLLGHGKDVFAAASQAIRDWKMFPREMTQVFWPNSPQQPGDTVAVLYRARPFFLWMLMPARVVYRVDERRRFGFAYGTLADHPERGEERFAVEWNERDDSVWYDLLALSQPAHWLARLAYPYARWEQAKFRRLSGRAMQRAVAASTKPQREILA
ncbi:MAG: DUF1990 domain-containing protein [Pirellulaceae bacterium]